MIKFVSDLRQIGGLLLVLRFPSPIKLTVTDRWLTPGPPVSFTNKTDRDDITEILLKVALNTIDLTLTLKISPPITDKKQKLFTLRLCEHLVSLTICWWSPVCSFPLFMRCVYLSFLCGVSLRSV